MVNAKRVTSSTNIPSDILVVWNRFRSTHRTIVYEKKIEGGASQCIAEVCTEIATGYQNNIVENFEAHLLKYLYYQLQNIFKVKQKYKALLLKYITHIYIYDI